MKIKRTYYEVNFNKTRKLINPAEINYAYSETRLCWLIMQNGEKYKFYKKLDEVEKELENIFPAFVRVAKSYLVNCNYIESYNRKQVIAIDGTVFPLGVRRYEEVTKKMQKMREYIITSDGVEIWQRKKQCRQRERMANAKYYEELKKKCDSMDSSDFQSELNNIISHMETYKLRYLYILITENLRS